MQGQRAFEYASTGAKCSTTGAGAAITAGAGTCTCAALTARTGVTDKVRCTAQLALTLRTSVLTPQPRQALGRRTAPLALALHAHGRSWRYDRGRHWRGALHNWRGAARTRPGLAPRRVRLALARSIRPPVLTPRSR